MNAGLHLEINLTELRRALDRALDHVEEFNGNTVAIPADYFWAVSVPGLYDVTSSPELTIGQLSESWGNLERERDGNGDDTLSFAAVWLGDILKALGHHTSG